MNGINQFHADLPQEQYEQGFIPTDAERAANRKAIMALSKKERFQTLLGHPKTIMNETDTPRTDAIIEQSWKSINLPNSPIPADFARQLERELTAAREESAGLRKEAQEKVTQMAHHLCQVEQQRDRLAEELREWKSNYNELSSHHNKHCTCMEIYQPRTNPRKNDMSEEMRREFEEFLKHNPELKCFNPEQAAWIAWSEAKKQISYELICRKCGLREERGEKPKCDF